MRRQTIAVGIAAAVLLALGMACTDPLSVLNPTLLSSLNSASQAASLPGTAAGLVVRVENRTNRAADLTVSYRAGDNTVQTYTTFLQPGGTSGQMLACPIGEITLGDIADLTVSGARVALIEGQVADLNNVPSIAVEAFARLLRENTSYKCGDDIRFVLSPSSTSVSGFGTSATIHSGQ